MSYLVLHKVDLEEHQARYYALVWQPALTGGWVVERTWGRLSSRSRQQKAELVVDAEHAQALAARHLRRRLQHGYRAVTGDHAGCLLATLKETGEGQAEVQDG